MTKINDFPVDSREALTAILRDLSLIDSTHVYAASVTFGIAHVYRFKSVSKIPIDSMESRCMLDIYNGSIAFKNGDPVKPGKGWLRRNQEQELRTYNG